MARAIGLALIRILDAASETGNKEKNDSPVYKEQVFEEIAII